MLKMDPKSTHLGGPGDTKITKNMQQWPQEQQLEMNIEKYAKTWDFVRLRVPPLPVNLDQQWTGKHTLKHVSKQKRKQPTSKPNSNQPTTNWPMNQSTITAANLSICFSIYLPAYLSIYEAINPTIYPSIRLSIYLAHQPSKQTLSSQAATSKQSIYPCPPTPSPSPPHPTSQPPIPTPDPQPLGVRFAHPNKRNTQENIRRLWKC